MDNLEKLKIHEKSPSELEPILDSTDNRKIKNEAERRLSSYGHCVSTDPDYGDKFDLLVTYENSHLSHHTDNPSNSDDIGSGEIQKLGYILESEGRTDEGNWYRHYRFDPYY